MCIRTLISSSVNIKYPSKQTVHRIAFKYSIFGLRGGKQRCNCSRQGQEPLHLPGASHLFLSWALLTVIVALITVTDKGEQLGHAELPHFIFIPMQNESKTSEIFSWCGNPWFESKHGQNLAGKAWLGTAGSSHETDTCLFASPPPWGHPGESREGFELWFPKTSVQSCNP